MKVEDALDAHLIIKDGPTPEFVFKNCYCLLILTAQNLASDGKLGLEELSVDTIGLLLTVIKDIKPEVKQIFEGILQQFCHSRMQFDDQLAQILINELLRQDNAAFEKSSLLTSFTIKLILKLDLPQELLKGHLSSLLNFIITTSL